MNKLFTLLLFIAFCGASFAQSDEYQNMGALGLKLKPITYDKMLPFRGIEIIDSRHDTSKLGFVMKGGWFKKVIVVGGLQKILMQELNDCLKSNFDFSKKESLLIVIKKLWLNEDYECESKLEVYLKSSEYYIPLIRLDSNNRTETSINKKDGSVILIPFQQCLIKLEHLDFNKAVSSSKKLTREQILAYNKKPFEYPIIEAAAKQRGIFLTFADFLQNKVSKLDFEVEFGKLTDELYVLNGKEKKLMTDLWGFCDGKKLFIKLGYSYCELYQQQNTFEFLGSIDYKRPVILSSPNIGNTSYKDAIAGGLIYEISKYSSYKRDTKPYQLNMETGKPY